MNLKKIAALLLVLGSVLGMAHAQGVDPGVDVRAPPVSTEESCQVERLLHFVEAPIKSRNELEGYLANLPKSSPLNALSEQKRKLFVDSLTFNDSGVTGFRSDLLEGDLGLTGAYRILALFGEQELAAMLKVNIETELDSTINKSLHGTDATCTGTGWSNYYCFKKGTCRSATSSICTSNC